MKRPISILVVTAILALVAGCASAPDAGSKDSGLYGSIGVGRSY